MTRNIILKYYSLYSIVKDTIINQAADSERLFIILNFIIRLLKEHTFL